jgi:hypothetical protein
MLPTWLAGIAAMALFTLATLALTPRLPYQDAGVLFQALLLKAGSLALLTAMTAWFSLCLPAAVSMALSPTTSIDTIACASTVRRSIANICATATHRRN